MIYSLHPNNLHNFWQWWDKSCDLEKNNQCGFLGLFGSAPKEDQINTHYLLFESNLSWEESKSSYPDLFDFQNLNIFDDIELKVCAVKESFIRRRSILEEES